MINIAAQRFAQQANRQMGRICSSSARRVCSSRGPVSTGRSAMKGKMSPKSLNGFKMQQASVLADSITRAMSTTTSSTENKDTATHGGGHESGLEEAGEEEVDDTRSSTSRTSSSEGKESAASSSGGGAEQQETVSATAEEAEAKGDGGAGGSEKEDEVLRLENRVAELEDQVKELSSNRQRLLAEMENVRHIAKKDVESAKLYSISKFAKQMLDVADNLRRALQAVPDDELEKEENKLLYNLHEGVKATDTQLRKILQEHDIHEYGEEGDDFDPNRHEAMFQIPAQSTEQEPGKIGQVLKTGFQFKDRILRPAQVGTVQDQ